MARDRYDVVVVGGGIVGMATARALGARFPRLTLAVLEKESSIGAHQTGHNSGVIHSGIYYAPGSLKARLCVRGREMLLDYCQNKGLPFDICGKVIVAVRGDELPALQLLYERGQANGLAGLEMIEADRLHHIEPHCQGVRAIRVPMTGIVDYGAVTRAYATDVESAGGEMLLGRAVTSMAQRSGGVEVSTVLGSVEARFVITCAGLYADRVARLTGADRSPQIVPFRGDYYTLRPERRALVNHLIYPVPNPAFPFLGVHFTRHLDGERSLGPNAVLAFAREGYGRSTVHRGELLEALTYPGFGRLARRYWRTGVGEIWRDLNKGAFVAALRDYIPDIQADDCLPGHAGVRAQALTLDGRLVDDFVISESARCVHVRNAPSPAATASLAIAEVIVQRAADTFGW